MFADDKRLGCELLLGDGTCWWLYASAPEARLVLACLAVSMGLRWCRRGPAHTVFRLEDASTLLARHLQPGDAATAGSIGNQSAPGRSLEEIWLTVQIKFAGQGLLQAIEARGGVPLHAALVALGEEGIVLAGPGGVGKSTAAARLPLPWKTLSDEQAIALYRPDDSTCVHPWPNWSRFDSDGIGVRWDVQRTLRLRAICFLVQSPTDRLEALTASQGTLLLLACMEQAAPLPVWGQDRDAVRRARLARIERAMRLVRMVPCYRLHLTLTGAFWHLLARLVTG